MNLKAVESRGKENLNPAGIDIIALWKEDLQTHDNLWLEPGFWALAVHRLGNWRMGIRSRLIRLPFSLFYKVLFRFLEWSCGISLPYTVRVGRRVRLWHNGGMVLHARSIGDDCHIRHNTTFGVCRTHVNDQIPTIGNSVDIGTGACVLGNVRLGDGCVIGANSVVLTDIPAKAVAVGIPARVIRIRE